MIEVWRDSGTPRGEVVHQSLILLEVLQGEHLGHVLNRAEIGVVPLEHRIK